MKHPEQSAAGEGRATPVAALSSALIVGGGAIETSGDFQTWFVAEIRHGMPGQRAEQADIPIHIMPNGDTAGARGAAIEALRYARTL